jgi:hypothetical protein
MEGIETLFQSSPTLCSPTLCISCARWIEIPNFSPFEGMTLALQAHLFNRLYQTRGTKLKFDTHLLHHAPQGLSATILYINSLRLSVTELGSIIEGRPGSARHSRNTGQAPWTLGFSPTRPAMRGTGPGPSQKADRAHPGTAHGCDGARRKTVVCVWRGRAAVAWN